MPEDTADIGALLGEYHVPGLSMAILRDGKEPVCTAYGLRDRASAHPVDSATVFEAASLTKPVFAFIVLTLAEAGRISLDEPLANYRPGYIETDPRAATITARHVLSHTTGLPNWRSNEYPLQTYFAPGSRFSYSGEGYVYLQAVIEKICSEPLDLLAHRLVFAPLGMTHSSFIWQNRFELNFAAPHTAAGTMFEDGFAGKRFIAANAAGSLYTTARDYARFLQAILQHPRRDTWLAPAANVLQGCLTCLDHAPVPAIDPAVAWGLGWGLETGTPAFFHWGDQKGYKAFAMGSPRNPTAVAVLTNGDSGLRFMSHLIAPVFPGPRPSLNWLGYEAIAG